MAHLPCLVQTFLVCQLTGGGCGTFTMSGCSNISCIAVSSLPCSLRIFLLKSWIGDVQQKSENISHSCLLTPM